MLTDKQANPLGNEPVYCNGEIIGKTTSAAYGYRVDAPVALALVKTDSTQSINGIEVELDIARQMVVGHIVEGAVYDPAGANMKINQSQGASHD